MRYSRKSVFFINIYNITDIMYSFSHNSSNPIASDKFSPYLKYRFLLHLNFHVPEDRPARLCPLSLHNNFWQKDGADYEENLAFFDSCFFLQGFHFPPDVASAFGSSISCNKDRTALDSLFPGKL